MVWIISLKQRIFCGTRRWLINCGVSRESILGSLLLLIYINNLPQPLNEARSLYHYADDTCIFYQDQDIEKKEKVLTKNCCHSLNDL